MATRESFISSSWGSKHSASVSQQRSSASTSGIATSTLMKRLRKRRPNWSSLWSKSESSNDICCFCSASLALEKKRIIAFMICP